MSKFYLFISLSLFSVVAFAQNYSIQSSYEFIEKGINFHDQSSYKSAIKEYDKVHRNDTNYSTALYEKSLSELSAEMNEACIITCKKGIELNKLNVELFYTTYGTALSNLKQYESAIAVYDSGIKQFPYNASLKYNKAVTLMESERYKEGLDLLYENIRMNPYHSNSHFLLANICNDLELEGQAAMAYLTYLLMETSTSRGFERLKMIDSYFAGNMDGQKKYTAITFLNQGFEGIDELIDNKVALNKKYKTPSKYSFPIIKQGHLLLSSLNTIDSEKGFWNEFYVPFYKKLMQDGQFEGFSYYILKCGDGAVDEITKTTAKKKSVINSFVSWYLKNFDNLIGYHELNGKQIQHHYSNGNLIAIGLYQNEIKEGNWQFFYSSGCIFNEGAFKNDKKTGKWVSYYSNGQIKNIYNFKDGIANGEYIEFHNNGSKSESGTFKDGLYDGVISHYTISGGLNLTETYKAGKLDGPMIYYYSNGKKRTEGVFKNEKINGDVINYSVNGQKIEYRNFVNSKVEGNSKTWYLDGSLKTEQEYQGGVENGLYKNYYKNGKLKEEGNYKAGILVGESKSYYPDGKIEVFNQFDERGKSTGLQKKNFQNGKLYYSFEYRKDEIYAYKYFDSTGKLLKEGEKNGKILEFEGYDQKGFLTQKGTYSKGLKEGVWNNYNPYKKVSAEFPYKDGKQNGLIKILYNNGNVKRSYPSVNGVSEGEYTELSLDGKIKLNDGYYRNDEETGEFVRKNVLNIVKNRVYYDNGKYDGWQTYYTEKGVLSYENFYINGAFWGSVRYDSAGKNGVKEWLDKGSGLHQRKYKNGAIRSNIYYKNGYADSTATYFYPNGKIQIKGDYLNDNRHGAWTYYHENGKVHKTISYEIGNAEGPYFEYFEDGTLEKKCTYKNDEIEGEYIINYQNGKLRYSENYVEGVLQGIAKYYLPTGELAIIRYYVDDFMVAYSYIGKDGKPVEPIKVNGEMQTITTYHQNGKIAYTGAIKNNDRQGETLWYYPDGKLFRKMTFVDDLVEGVMIAYHANGNKYYESNLKNDLSHGTYTEYYANGSIKMEKNYFLGDLFGDYKTYDSNKKLIANRYYYDGEYYNGNF